jgi:hypothetical protein
VAKSYATRIATVTGAPGFIDAVAFPPAGSLLAEVSYQGTVTMFSLTTPARPARVATMQTLPAAQLAADPWHQLLELCGLTGTPICDEDGLYDPRSFNDRLLLGCGPGP